MVVPVTEDSTPAESTSEEPAADDRTSDATVGRGLLEQDVGPSSAMAHLYRGEIHRMKLWRERLGADLPWPGSAAIGQIPGVLVTGSWR